MDIVRMELAHLGGAALQMVRGALSGVIEGSAETLDRLAKMDNDVDTLHGAIVTYLGRLSQENLTDGQSEQLHDYLAAANYFENIGDIVETNLVETGRARLRLQLVVSAPTRDVLTRFHSKVCWALERTIKALVENDQELAREVMAAKSAINQLAAEAEGHLVRRLAAAEPNRLAAFRLESEIIEYFKRVYYFSKRIAKDVAEVEFAYVEGHAETPADADAEPLVSGRVGESQ
jgi:phosphate:Na+ symporter